MLKLNTTHQYLYTYALSMFVTHDGIKYFLKRSVLHLIVASLLEARKL